MSELKRYLVLFVAFVAFLLAGYIQGGGTWRGPHNLRKSIPAKGATVGMAELPRGGAPSGRLKKRRGSITKTKEPRPIVDRRAAFRGWRFQI